MMRRGGWERERVIGGEVAARRVSGTGDGTVDLKGDEMAGETGDGACWGRGAIS